MLATWVLMTVLATVNESESARSPEPPLCVLALDHATRATLNRLGEEAVVVRLFTVPDSYEVPPVPLWVDALIINESADDASQLWQARIASQGVRIVALDGRHRWDELESERRRLRAVHALLLELRPRQAARWNAALRREMLRLRPPSTSHVST